MRRFGVNHGNNHPIQHSQGDESLLAIVESIIRVRKSHPRKHSRGIGKIKTMLFQVYDALCFVPSESHCLIVYTLRIFVKDCFSGSGRVCRPTVAFTFRGGKVNRLSRLIVRPPRSGATPGSAATPHPHSAPLVNAHDIPEDVLRSPALPDYKHP